jgi:hypothetical protein
VVQVTYLQNGAPLETKAETIDKFENTITLSLMVHAGADTIRLHSDFFQLQFAPPPKDMTLEERKQMETEHMTALREGRRALLKSVIGRRWRDIVLDHLNEWTTTNLVKYLMARLEAGYFERARGESDQAAQARLVELFDPLTWWAPKSAQEVEHGEQSALGDGSRHPTIFDADKCFLPKDAHIENMHPVTALWLLDLLLDEKTGAIRQSWPPDTLVVAKKERQPLFFGVVTQAAGKGPAIGSGMTIAVVEHGYHSSGPSNEPGVAFVVESPGKTPRIAATALYVDGAAVARIRLSFWGETTYKVEMLQANSEERIALQPEKTGTTKVSASRPNPAADSLHLVHTAGSSPKAKEWTGSILIKDGEPWALEGYLAFEGWKSGLKDTPNTSVPGEPGKFLWPIVAERSKPERHERNGLLFEGDFIVGVPEVRLKKGKTKPGSPKRARITDNYVLQGFIGTKAKPVAEATGAEF